VTVIQEFWGRFDRGARAGLVVGAILILGVSVFLGMALLRTDYQVLFADLAPQDAATITAELEKMKMPYRLDKDGNTILVPAEQVHKTRLKLVGRELPLRGAVGFELFNTSEVGMTEFTQKINYQRALQGELTRTILALDEVQSARVHLVLAEQGLFKKTARQAKASISIAAKPGRSLDAAQIQGIQRLVSAAVPDIRAADVTIVDQHGVALTRRAAEGEDATNGLAAAADGLDDKRALESYLQKKVAEVLERTFGAGQAIASVDVTLGHSHSKVTTESVLGNGAGAGVKVRERVTSRDGAAETGDAEHPGTSSHEADYQVGRRVEQVVSGAGGVARINVAVVVRANQDQQQLDRLRDVVALAAGIDRERGDAVSVYAMGQLANPQAAPAGQLAAGAAADEPPASLPAAVPPAPADGKRGSDIVLALVALGAVAAAGGAGMLLLGRRRATQTRLRQLSLDERRAVLAQVNTWLEAPRQPLREES
jgi:flagellar M-ring protein FliF